MARRLAVVISHAPGLSGTPCSGHFSSAATMLSWTTSSARSKSPRRRTRAPVSRPASSRKTATTAPSVAAGGSSWSVVHYRPHFHGAAAGPRLRHRQRLIEVLDLYDREAPDDLFGLDERAVGDRHLAVLVADRGRGARPAKLLTADDAAGLAVLLEPLVDALISGFQLLFAQLLPLLLLLGGAREHEDVLHSEPPGRAVIGAASPTRRTGVPDSTAS